ncbi:MAG: hypothetical protein ABIR70_19575 [Bryobacteraceae bacterium]
MTFRPSPLTLVLAVLVPVLRYWTINILKTDGNQVGTIQAEGPIGQPPPPGVPMAVTAGS